MGCYDELTYATHADGELAPAEAAAVESHLGTCTACRALVRSLAAESRVIAGALAGAPDSAVARVPAPARAGASGRREARLAVAWAGLAATILGLLGWWGVEPVTWTDAGVAAALGVLPEAALLVARHGDLLAGVVEAMALGAMAVLGVTAAVVALRPSPSGWGRMPVLVGPWLLPAALGLGLTAQAGPASALELRSGSLVQVGRGEHVAGTLVAAGERVVVDGTVDGDLIVAGRSVEIGGRVRGDVVAAGRTVALTGVVDGDLYLAAARADVAGSVAAALYAAARDVRLAAGGRIGRDATLAARTAWLDGTVGRDLTLAAADGRVGGVVGRHLVVRAGRLELASTARVGGDAQLGVRAPEGARIAEGAVVGGTRRVDPWTTWRWRRARWPGRLFWTAAGFFAALLWGALALWLLPGFCQATAERVGAFGRSLVTGVVVLVVVPLLAAAAGLTLIGVPSALALLAAYVVALYAAKLAVGAHVGRRLLGDGGHGLSPALRALAVGLLILTALVRLPFLGGVIQLAVLCLGLGAIATELRSRIRPA